MVAWWRGGVVAWWLEYRTLNRENLGSNRLAVVSKL